MLVILPIAFLVVVSISLIGYRSSRDSSFWQGDVLIAAAFSGMLIVLIIEVLGAFSLIMQAAVAFAWGAALSVTVMLSWRNECLQTGWVTVVSARPRLKAAHKVLLVGIVIVVAVLFLIAAVSPPNTVDSLLYHMSRVVHWAQNRSIEHYATAYDHQLLKPPWAEMSILNLRVLWGSDRPANLVQWASMIGSIVGVTGIVRLLGGRRGGQILAATFAVSIPMGVLQATSTQNDYVAAFWVVCLAYLVVLNHKRRLRHLELLALAGAFGLGLLTKGTVYVYVPPFMIWFLIVVLRRSGLGQMVRAGLVVGLVALVINVGFWSRNIVTYGGPYGPSDYLSANFTLRLLPRSAGSGELDKGSSLESTAPEAEVGAPDGGTARRQTGPLDGRTPIEETLKSLLPLDLIGWASHRVINLATLNLVTPSSAVNSLIRTGLERLPELFGPELFARMEEVAWSHEDTAANPLHLVFVPISLAALVALRPKNLRFFGIYIAACLASYSLVALLIGHGTIVWGLRYQLPFFVVWAPVVGATFDAARRPAVTSVLSGLFILAAIPWVLFNNMRPVIGLPPWPTRTASVFEASSDELLLAIAPHSREGFRSASDDILESGCNRVGLRMDSGDLEYAVWRMLDAPESGIRVETIYPQLHLQHLIDSEFRPCAIVCTICESEQIHGLPLVVDKQPVRLYRGSGYVSDSEG